MRNLTHKLVLTAAIVLTAASNSFGQASASTTASATIVTPIAISKTTDINFGNVAVSAVNAGTVVLPAAATPTRTTGGAGGVTLPTTAGTVTAAKYTVTGETGYTYALTLPSSVTITKSGGGATMNVNAFTSSLGVTNEGTLAGGTDEIYVGATLNVAAAQAAGSYTSSAFDITVNYN